MICFHSLAVPRLLGVKLMAPGRILMAGDLQILRQSIQLELRFWPEALRIPPFMLPLDYVM
jgi:hypothetical protein